RDRYRQVGQGRPAPWRCVQRDHEPVGRVPGRDLLGSLDLDAVALAVVEGEGHERLVLAGCDGEAHGRVHPARQDDDRSVTARLRAFTVTEAEHLAASV